MISLDGGLPLIYLLFGLRQFGDVGAGMVQRDELAIIGEHNRFVERSLPATISQ